MPMAWDHSGEPLIINTHIGEESAALTWVSVRCETIADSEILNTVHLMT